MTRRGSVDAVDRQADGQVDILRRLAAIERLGHVHPLFPGGFRNMADNGAMAVAQRNIVLAGVASDSGQRVVDRSVYRNNAAGVYTYQQVFDPVPGTPITFAYEALCTTADAALAAGDFLIFSHTIEGLNAQNLMWGTVTGKPVTVSWYQKTNYLAGSAVAEMFRAETGQRSISAAVPANALANVWERKSVTFVPDATTVISADATGRCTFDLWLAAGSTYTGGGSLQSAWGAVTTNKRAFGVGNVSATVNNYVRITGLQIEAGVTATEFEWRDIGTEIARCQRYAFFPGYVVPTASYVYLGHGWGINTTQATIQLPFPVYMRAIPTWDSNQAAIGNMLLFDRAGGSVACTSLVFDIVTNPHVGSLTANVAAGLTLNKEYQLLKNAGTAGSGGWTADI